jgi:hypothetical protein
MDSYTGQHKASLDISGPQNGAVNAVDIVTIFLMLFITDMTERNVAETNHFAQQFINSKTLPLRSVVRHWTTVTVDKMYVVTGLFLLIGTINKPTIRSCSTTRRILSTPGFGNMMSRDRFKAISKFLHFADNISSENYDGSCRLFNIFPITLHLNKKFQNLYIPAQNIWLENPSLWKGRLSFKQYLPLIAFKLGIMTYELCET